MHAPIKVTLLLPPLHEGGEERTLPTVLGPENGSDVVWNTAGSLLDKHGVEYDKGLFQILVGKSADSMRRSDVGRILKDGWFVGVSRKIPRLPVETDANYEQARAERADWQRNQLLGKLGGIVAAITAKEGELNRIEQELEGLELSLSSFQIFCGELRNEIDRLVKQRMMSMRFLGEKKWDLRYNITFHSLRTDEINQLVFRKSGEAVKIRHELRKLREGRDRISASPQAQS